MIESVMKRRVVAWTLGLAAVPGTALAHPPVPAAHLATASGGAHGAHHHALASSSLPALLLLAMAAAALAWVIGRDRRLVRFTLVLVLGWGGVEAAYHGVHHLGDRDAATKCVVFAASAHVEGLSDDRPTAPAPADALESVPPRRRAPTPTLTLAGLHEGRAPPRFASL